MTETSFPTAEANIDAGGRPTGVVIIVASIITIVSMSLHPSIASRGLEGFVAEATREARFNGIVHGTLIGAMGVLVAGFLGLSQRLCMQNLAVCAAFIAYTLGAVAMMGAATLNGFVVSGLAARYADATGDALEHLRPLLALTHAIADTAARIGVGHWCIAVLLWSLVLLRRGGATRGVGLLGVLVGAAPFLLLVTGHLRMHVHGFGVFVLVQCIWNSAAAVLLIRGRI
jgi:hypothetical protein